MKTTVALALAASAAGAAAATSSPPNGWTYVGCVQADVSSFPVVVDFFAPFKAEQCLTACGTFGYAALKGGCYCAPSTPKPSYKVVDEAKCGSLCTKDPADGICGGAESYSLYKRDTGGEQPTSTSTDKPKDKPTDKPTGHSTNSTITTSYPVLTCTGIEDTRCPHPTTSSGPYGNTTKTHQPTTKPTHSEPTKSEPTKSEPTKNEPTKTGPTQTQPTQTEPPFATAGAARIVGNVVAGIAAMGAFLL